MLADSGMKHLAPFAQQAIDDNYVKPSKRIFDNSQGQRPLRHHPDAAGAQRPVGRRAEALRPGGAALPVGVLPERRVPGHHAHQPGAWATASAPTARCWSSRAGWPSTARKPQDDEQGRRQGGKNLVPVKPGEMVRAETVDAKGLKTRPPARYSRSHAAGRHGRRRQDRRGRRAARGDAGEGPGHAGHARRHHRRPDQREVHAARRPRADPHGQGLPAHDAAARPGRGGAVQARAHRRVGIQAGADGARQAVARRLHARDRRDDASTSSRRPRSTTATPCRATTPRCTTPCPNCGGVVQENYRRYTCIGKPRPGALRLLVHQDPGRPHLRAGRGRAASCATSTSARWRASAPRRAGRSPPRSR